MARPNFLKIFARFGPRLTCMSVGRSEEFWRVCQQATRSGLVALSNPWAGNGGNRARPLRIQKSNAWYHLTARGNERRPIYRDQRDRQHFCELLAELDNHYHLVAETAEANL